MEHERDRATDDGTPVLGLGAQPATAAAGPNLVGQWRIDEGDGQVAVDDGPHRLNGRLGQTDALEATDPARIPGASGRALAFEGNASVGLPEGDALAVQTLSAETVVRAPASPGEVRYLISRGSHRCFAGSYGLYMAAAGGVVLYVFDGSDGQGSEQGSQRRIRLAAGDHQRAR
jgi:hypothetical protein